jgi:hypothetical protein
MCHSHQIGYALAKARIEDMQRSAAASAPRGRGRWSARRRRAVARLARILTPAMPMRRERRQ